MYKRKYRYNEKYFSDFVFFLNSLHERSINQYLNTYAKNDTPQEQKNNILKINSYIGYLEDYIVALTELGFINKSNVKDVLNEIQKIKSISVLPKNLRGIYGLTTPDKRIEINPELKASKTLNSEERTLLYVAHEVGHIIHNMWLPAIQEYVRSAPNNPNINDLCLQTSRNDRVCAMNGFRLIDEATTQETAEIVVYHTKKKKRPPLTYYSTPQIFNGTEYKSNFDYYKELEEPAILFGRTLRGIGTSSKTPDSEIMSQLAKRALDKNFGTKIIKEYQENKELERDFFYTLICLGRIKDASYGMFGMATFHDSTSISEKHFNTLKFLCNKNEDYRPKQKKI